MNTVEKATFQDLIDGNACVGPDGGIWYPSGHADVPVANIFTAMVEEVRRLRSVIDDATSALDDAQELNMSNYDEDQVADLNSAYCHAYAILMCKAGA